MTAPTRYAELDPPGPVYYTLLCWIGLFVAAGLGAAWAMEHFGHEITGMTNRIVWGTPHVFAVFLIVAASGALNVASIATVFGRALYKPLGRLSAVLALALLAGGLMVLVLDLGRPDRLIVAMTHYNFKSIFAWNIFLYSGFFAVVLVYLWLMMERRMVRYSKAAGVFALVWRLALTTGTGAIFGFLIARQAYDAAIMAPLFIIMSFSFGMAAFILVLLAACGVGRRPLGEAILGRLGRLLGVFVAAVLYFVTVQHLTNLYAPEHLGVEAFILVDGGVYTFLFWVVQVGLGGLLPLAILFHPLAGKSRRMVGAAAALVMVGGLAQVYVIIIGGQAYPLSMFPGMEVASSFFDGGIAAYTPSLPEIALGLSGVAMALGLVTVGLKVLPLLPTSLADVDPQPRPADPPGGGADKDEIPEAA